MWTRAIFIRPDSELIWESVCVCAKLFVDEENVLNSNRARTKMTQKGGFYKPCVKKKKNVILTYSIFQHVYAKHNLVSFFGRIIF